LLRISLDFIKTVRTGQGPFSLFSLFSLFLAFLVFLQMKGFLLYRVLSEDDYGQL